MGRIDTIETMTFASSPSRARRVVRTGDVLVSTVRTYLKAIAPVANAPDNLIASTGFAVIRCGKEASPAYIKYVLRTDGFVGNVIANSVGVSYPAINASDLVRLLVPIPALSEQTQIARFLDYKIARIDALIEKQQQLIALLKEKRQAVISHAVTEGLNPNTPLRDSGVEYFAKVPKHWSVSRLGLVAEVVRGGSPRPAGDPRLFDGDFSPWVTVSEITKDTSLYLEATESFLTRLGSTQCRVFEPNTLLLSNSGATLGVPKILKIRANANDGVIGFERLRLPLQFVYFYLSTLTGRLRQEIKNKGGSTQINLNTDIVKKLPVPLPPVEEAVAIGTFLEREMQRYESIRERGVEAIELLQERRTALISAAVTGKIDVRNWTPPESKPQRDVA